jgi:PmbA protein
MKDIIEKTISMANDLKIDQCDVILSESQSLNLSSQEGKIETYKVNSSRLIGVRVIHGQKVGISYSEDLSDSSLKTMVQSALKSSSFAEVDEYQAITHEKATIIDENPKTFRDDHTEIQTKIDLAIQLDNEVKRQEPRTSAVPYNGYSESSNHRHYGNHLGLYSYERDKTFSCYTSSLIKDGDKQALFYDGMSGRTFAELNPQEVIKNAIYKTRILLDASPIPTGNYDLIFETETLESLLGCFLGQFSGKSVKDGYSSFKDSIDQKIAHPEFSLRDLPHYEEGFICAHSDSEGFIKKDLHLIEKGELRTFYHNSATARYFGVANTGHASRGAKGHLSTSLTQLFIDAGSSSNNQLLSGKTLHIFALDGLHAGVNPSSGDFSLAASGQIYENGEATQGVKGITISGNFFALLKNIEAIGSTVHTTSNRSFFAPSIRFGGIKVAGI